MPVVRSAESAAAHILQRDESGQVRIFRPQAVCDPASYGGKTHAELPGLHLVGRLYMVVGPAPHRVQKCNLVYFRTEVRKDLRHILSALSILLEFENARHDRTRPAVVDADIAGQDLTRVFFQRRLVVKGIYLADPAGHEERDDGFRARLEMRRLWRKRVNADQGRGASVDWRRLRARKEFLIVEHLSEGQPRDATTGLKQKIASRPDILHFDHLVYKNSLRLSMTLVKSTSEPDPIISVAIDSSFDVGGRVSASRYARS